MPFLFLGGTWWKFFHNRGIVGPRMNRKELGCCKIVQQLWNILEFCIVFVGSKVICQGHPAGKPQFPSNRLFAFIVVQTTQSHDNVA